VVRTLLTPRMLALHALGVVATTAAVLLGLWQLDAWQAGRDHEARDLAGAAPRPLADVMTADGAFPGQHVGRPVTFSGRWLPGSTVLVDGRELDGRRGFWAVTPVAVCAGPATSCDGSEPAMLVVRGWAPTPIAVPPPPRGRVDLTGWLQPGEGAGLPDPDPDDEVLSELRIASAIQHVDQDLYGGFVVARDGAPEEDLEPVTPDSLPEPSSFTSLQNLLYAFQWWLFGGFAVFLWQRWVRDELDRQRHGDRDAEQEPRTAEIASTP
jgi:surfeit locus 1 family protein